MFIITAYEGQVIRVGDRLLRVGHLRSPGVVELQADGEADHFLVSADRKTEVFPEVFLAIERNLHMSNRVKFLFEAPRIIRIRELPHDPSL